MSVWLARAPPRAVATTTAAPVLALVLALAPVQALALALAAVGAADGATVVATAAAVAAEAVAAVVVTAVVIAVEAEAAAAVVVGAVAEVAATTTAAAVAVVAVATGAISAVDQLGEATDLGEGRRPCALGSWLVHHSSMLRCNNHHKRHVCLHVVLCCGTLMLGCQTTSQRSQEQLSVHVCSSKAIQCSMTQHVHGTHSWSGFGRGRCSAGGEVGRATGCATTGTGH